MICKSRFSLLRNFRRSQYLRPCAAMLIFFLFMGVQMTGCGAIKTQPYHADPFASYGNQTAKNDLHIAIQPMIDKDEQEKYFGVVLSDAGILPIFVFAENRNVSNRFMFRDDHIELRNKITNARYPKPLLTDASDDSHLEGTKKTALIAGNVLLSAPLLFASLGLARNSEKVKSIQDNMFEKTLFSQTILPGKTANGFAYFKIADSSIDLSSVKSMMRNLVLAIQVTDMGAQSVCDFQFSLGF